MRRILSSVLVLFVLFRLDAASASDHLDTPTVIADPRADIGDIYAWMAPSGRELNLVMTLVGHTFSDKITYAFHIDSGESFGNTTATILVECRFPAHQSADCHVGDDRVQGDANRPEGLWSSKHQFRVFAGLRDDPFFNNVKGTRAAYKKADEALSKGDVRVDQAGCASFDAATVQAVRNEWRHTDGAPATNFLAGWLSSAIVVSVDLRAVTKGGHLLAVWGSTTNASRQVDRAARPLTGNALLGTLSSEAVSNALKEQYNATTPAEGSRFIGEIEKGLALYDGFDGACGNQLLADSRAASVDRYRAMATLLADDRIWMNSKSTVCTQLFAVELASRAGRSEWGGDCGGRSPNYDAANVYRSVLADGTSTSINDGLHADERTHSATVFPFLAAPDEGPTRPANDKATGSYQ
jgi:hypothetical protein